MNGQPVAGDFDFRAMAGPCEYPLAEYQPSTPVHGLQLQVDYFYGGLAGADGRRFIVYRKFSSALSSGLGLMSDAGGAFDFVPQAFRTARGEVRRKHTKETRGWSDHILHAAIVKLDPAGEFPLDLVVDDTHLSWSEGELLNLSGVSMGTGIQALLPMQTVGSWMDCAKPYWVTGTILGEAVEGPVVVARMYFQHGLEWKELGFYKDVQVSWVEFCNRFDDGTTEFGIIARGRRGFAFGVVVAGEDVVASSSEGSGSIVLDQNDSVAAATFDAGGEEWEFTGGSPLSGYTKARTDGYRAQWGTVLRNGETRKPVNQWAWMECFPDRIRQEGLLRG